jgi:hypothetical protein
MIAFILYKKGVSGYYTLELVKKYLIHSTQYKVMENYLDRKGLNAKQIADALFSEATIPGSTGLFNDSEVRHFISHNKAMPGLLGYVSIDIISNGLEHHGRKDFQKMTSCLDYADPEY